MKIKYIHQSDPDKAKIFDTVVAYNKTPHNFKHKTQEEYDILTLCRMKEDKELGIILSYEVIEDNV